MIKLFNEGGRRPFALANRAIVEVEREKQPQAVPLNGMYDKAA